MAFKTGAKARSLSLRLRLSTALAASLGVAMVFASVEAEAQSRGNDGVGKIYRGGGRGHGGGGGGRAVAGGLIGLGAGLAIGAATADRRRVREETVIEEYEERPVRRPARLRRAPVEVVEEEYYEPRAPRRFRRDPDADIADVDPMDEPAPPRKRPAAKPKPKIVKIAPVKPADKAEPKPAPAAETATAAPPPPAATPPAAPVVAPPPPPPVVAAGAAGPDEVPGEVLIEVASSLAPQEVDDLAARQRLERIESSKMELTGTTVFRWRIPDGRSVDEVVDALRAEPNVRSVQPNHIYELSEALAADLTSTQYSVAKMRLDEAHGAATGKGVAIAVIDSAVDPTHPSLKGAVVETFDPIGGAAAPDAHGTAVAGLAAGRGELASPAPNAEIYSVRAFAPERKGKAGAQGTTMHILRGLDWAASRGVRVVNMSFAGPKDTKIAEFIAAGAAKGAIYVAAAGNAGPSSPPLYPAADPNVIAVTATDAEDRLLPAANRGDYLSVAAPGVDVLVATPGGGFGFLSGTSMASAEVAGLVALMTEAEPGLPAWRARAALTSSARDLGAAGPDTEFGAGSADAMGALEALGIAPQTPVASAERKAADAGATRASADAEVSADADVPPDAASR